MRNFYRRRAQDRALFVRRPLKTTFDMTTLIFSAGGCPSYPVYFFKSLKGALGTLFSWLMTENPSREVATKDHSSSNPQKGNPPDLKTKVDVSKVDVKGFQILKWFRTQQYSPPFAGLWLSGKEKAHKQKQFWPVIGWMRGGVSRPGGQGLNVYVLCSEPREHKHFRPGARPGGLVSQWWPGWPRN